VTAIKRRTLTDSEARWEAASMIADVVTGSIESGHVVTRGEEEGWTMADMVAVEQHMGDRVAGLLRRHRKPRSSGRSEP
jgi:hypothetical protein